MMEDATVESAGQAKVARTSEGSENVANETNSSTLPDRLAPQKGDCIVFVSYKPPNCRPLNCDPGWTASSAPQECR